MIRRHTLDNLSVYSFPRLEASGARHAISTRLGGVSQGAFARLNLGYSVGDDPACVAENRRRLFAGLDIPVARVVSCHQVHGTSVARVADDCGGRGALTPTQTIPATDALITDEPGLYVFLRFADCVPILLCDPEHHAVGLAHAGWKGTVGNIAEKTVVAMAAAFASRPRGIVAAIGPCIGPCHYEIREDVAGEVRRALPFWTEVMHPGRNGSFYFDLVEANRRLLLAAGVVAENIVVSGLCTACHSDEFYSHRAEAGTTGRFGVLIAWAGDARP